MSLILNLEYNTGVLPIAIEGWVAQTLRFACIFFATSYAPSALTEGTLKSGITISRDLALGGIHSYEFNANEGEPVHIRVVDQKADGFYPNVWLYNPDGSLIRRKNDPLVITFDCYSASPDCRLRQTGAHRLVISDTRGDSVGSYKVAILRALKSNKNGALINGGVVTGNLSIGDLDTFVFEASESDPAHIRVTENNEEGVTPLVWLYNPDGSLNRSKDGSPTVSFNCHSASPDCRLKQTGTYRLVIGAARDGDTGSYQVRFIGPNQAAIDRAIPDRPMIDGGVAISDDKLSIFNNQKNETENISRAYNASLKNPEQPPEYLYRTESINENIATAWMMITDGVRGHGDQKALYDQFYSASLDYLNLKKTSLHAAKREIDSGNAELANQFYSDSLRYGKQYNSSAKAAIDIYNGELDSAKTLAEGVYNGSKAAAIFGSKMILGPTGASTVDKLFTATDFYINQSEFGTELAVNELVTSQIVSTLLNKVPISSLGGNTINHAIEDSATTSIGRSQLYSLLNEAIDSEEAKESIMKFIAGSGAIAASEGTAYAAEQYLKLTQHLKQQLELD